MQLKKVIRSIIILLLMSTPLFGCVRDYVKTESRSGYYYVVKSGDTLSSVAHEHRVSLDELAELNNLDKSLSIKEGLVLFVPQEDSTKKLNQAKEKKLGDKIDDTLSQKKQTDHHTNKTPSKTEIAKKPDITKKDKTSLPQETVKIKAESKDKIPQEGHSKTAIASNKAEGVQKGKFILPIMGKVISQYGPQANGMFYNGIRIETKTEVAVSASSGGHVIFSALLKDYGETIIIKHENNYATVYTHLTKRLVRVDQIVKRAEKIAMITPLSTGVAFIDFEIRYKNKAKDPMLFLP